MMTPDQFRWAEALALEKLHGDAAPHYGCWLAFGLERPANTFGGDS